MPLRGGSPASVRAVEVVKFQQLVMLQLNLSPLGCVPFRFAELGKKSTVFKGMCFKKQIEEHRHAAPGCGLAR